MLISTFLHEWKQANAVRITKDWILFRKPIELYNLATDETIAFKKIEDAIAYEIDGKKVADIIQSAKVDIFKLTLDGGRGASGSSWSGKFGHAGGGGGGTGKTDLPARMNTKIDIRGKSPEAVLKEFRKLHVPDNKESAVTVDANGYVTQYVHGGAHSVYISGKKGEMVYHNHPSGGAFSDSDLISTATTSAKGIVASGKKGDYIFQKTGHFKANAFVKAVRNAKLKGKNYDDAADKWLKRNQKKYGYKYAFAKA